MKHKLLIALPLMTMFLALAPSAIAATTWYVNGVSGSDSNDCKTPATACKTIGHAISLAHSGDSIMVAAATYTEHLGIGFNLTITGSGAGTTVIDGGGYGPVVGIVGSPVNVTLSKVTVRHGYALFGGGIFNTGPRFTKNTGTLTINKSAISGNRAVWDEIGGRGGGVFSYGTLIINNSTIRGNHADSFGGGIAGGSGGTITNSTISGNTGGGVSNGGTLAITNSTISGNSASNFGGGIDNGGTLTINNSTISGNSSTNGGGGIFNGGKATLQNSIVANSPSGGNCSGTITSNGYNLSSDNTCNFNNTGDLNNTDPNLGSLQNNGGPTHTQALLSGSPAIDAGNPSGCTDGQGHLLATDQRGKPRPDKEDSGGCDMGAYESQTD